MEQDFDIDPVIDAMIEDTFHWQCPECEFEYNTGLAGEEEFVCRSCSSVFEMGDNAEMIRLDECLKCGGYGINSHNQKCDACDGEGFTRASK